MSRLKDYIIIEASKSDIRQIQDLSDIAFRSTYKDILSAEQLEYMMDWMYSSESLQNQFEQGHHYFIAYLDNIPVGYASLQPEGT
ncbi:MAG: GNAT family N-acetyltransferase, partial [Bacteroidales bacterium]|nr:GNAT family N-acetyltransferase [Bacteroidales bacterium]